MWSKVNFVKKSLKKSFMARNAIEREFRTSKMATGSHFVKNKITNVKKWFVDIQKGYRRAFKKKTFTKKVERVIWTMFEPTAGRLQLYINSLLVNIYIYTYRYVGNEGIYIVYIPLHQS